MSSKSIFRNIPRHWLVTTLGELAKTSGGDIQTGPFGSQLHARDYVDDGIPSIMPKNISVDGVVTDEIARVSPTDAERLSKYRVQTGDIVYSRRGDVEKCARITERENGWLCGTGCIRIRVKSVLVSPEYLHAYLCHPAVRKWIVRHAVGATMPNLNTSILSALPVVIPSKPEMESIAAFWLNISDKIQVNHQINQTLEQIARAIFKSWFVDFEPVKAKIAALEAGGSEEDALLAAMQAISGKSADELARLKAENPEQYAELRSTAELFPSAMQESELGEIPKGWSCIKLETLCTTITKGTTPKKSDLSEARDRAIVPFIKVKDITDTGEIIQKGLELIPESISRKSLKRSVLKNGDLLFSIAGTIGRIAIVDTTLEDSNTNQAVGIIRLREKERYLAAVWQTLLSDRVQNEIRSKVVQGVQANASLKNLRNILVVRPSDNLLNVASSHLNALLKGIISNHAQSRSLTELRDTLLPKLLSGELSVAAAEEQMKEAVEA